MMKLYLITLIFNVCILSATAQTSAKQNAQQAYRLSESYDGQMQT